MFIYVSHLLNQFQRTFEGEAWHGPAVMEVLKDVDHVTAAAKPVAGAHSIWELVLHLAWTNDLARWRIEGDERIYTDDDHFPPVTGTGETGWADVLKTLRTAHDRLVQAVSELPEQRLEEEVPAGSGVSHALRLHGVIQHDLYHAGQIALLKKAQR